MKIGFKTTGLEKAQERIEKLLRGPIDKETAKKIGDEAVKSIKELCAAGISPVTGGGFGGKFPPYKNPKRYPGKKKNHSPVNLKLTGKFLANLGYKIERDPDSGYYPTIGYSRQSERLKEQGHREGANKQPKRPTLPMKGESFAQLVRDSYRRVILDAVKKLTK